MVNNINIAWPSLYGPADFSRCVCAEEAPPAKVRLRWERGIPCAGVDGYTIGGANRLYIPVGGKHIWCVDPASGETRWKAENVRHGDCYLGSALWWDGCHLVTLDKTHVNVIDPATGNTLLAVPNPQGYQVYYVGRNTIVLPPCRYIELTSGKCRNRALAGSPIEHGYQVMHEGAMVTQSIEDHGTHYKRVSYWDWELKAQRWARDLPHAPLTRCVYEGDGVIVVHNADWQNWSGTLQCLDADTGQERWQMPNPFNPISSVQGMYQGTVCGGLFVGLFVDRDVVTTPVLRAIRLATGAIAWEVKQTVSYLGFPVTAGSSVVTLSRSRDTVLLSTYLQPSGELLHEVRIPQGASGHGARLVGVMNQSVYLLHDRRILSYGEPAAVNRGRSVTTALMATHAPKGRRGGRQIQRPR